jgi:hypothetical protein
MKWEEQKALHQKVVAAEADLLTRKGAEYASSDVDSLANFKRNGANLGLDPKQILWIYCSKHLDSITSFIKKGSVTSNEPIEGRIADARNYLFLLQCLVEEERNNERAKHGTSGVLSISGPVSGISVGGTFPPGSVCYTSPPLPGTITVKS